MSESSYLAAIVDALSDRELPPVHLWQPSHVRDIDMRIARNGDWFFQGSRINRVRMVKLFSTVLRVDEGQTYLVTPQERLRIEVEDAPFTAVLMECHEVYDQQQLVFTTNLGDQVRADQEHPIVVHYEDADGEPMPYITVRDQLRALISRAVFYQLAELSEIRDGVFGVMSSGHFMPLAATNQSS